MWEHNRDALKLIIRHAHNSYAHSDDAKQPGCDLSFQDLLLGLDGPRIKGK